ncbi:grasp-with-spasm system ATP-grasp peptide maturase [Chryseobacterium sp. PMSZPI]|uniref:grasp-with-spasm system ATP-grasp peptide maturase n=1 Tax=Chryseobacterium sp. PMSZPI TaxID=1033900 RepID=UPI000C3390F9|nr:grasp-with-spasm system ATP-grasp peptide maturase [Chryseobacterium sp. PMSZPI]PKF75575.1 grasp-with-spasm system ATP-grasp peptide maturase [Chryseobacterium sp. PMSZPI]
MILIISKNKEATTDEVIKWLFVMDKKFIRVNEDEVFEIKTKEKRIYIESSKNSFFIDEIESVWYRRGGLKFKRLQYENPSVDMHMSEHQHWLEDYVIKMLESKKYINKQSNCHVNKLLVLKKAENLGLDVPSYYLAENTNHIHLGQSIVKPIAGNPTLENISEDIYGVMYTAVIDKYRTDEFFISFFQEKIDKDFEIRAFYLNGKCWSMAIFSQKDQQTKVDYRKYNDKKPNRNVPYKLPDNIEEKIHQLMTSLDPNCGSIDFIKKDNKFYFLEVNPVGQFLNVSRICNYFLDREIAEYL